MNESTAHFVIDGTDRRILEEMQRDASATNQELAARCATSPATCLRRVRRLREAGVIERLVAILAPGLLGPTLSVIAEVTLDRQGSEHLAAFERRAVADPAVRQAYRVSPGPDFVLFVQVPDMGGWAAFAERLFTQDTNVRNVKTYFAIRRAKFETSIDLPMPTS